jgi:hypothetical protein
MMVLYMAFIAVERVAMGQPRLKNGLGRDGAVSARRKWSGSGQKMAVIILSHHSNPLSFRTSVMVRMATL